MAYKCVNAGCTCRVALKAMYCHAKCATGATGNAKCECGHLSCKGR